MASAILRVSKKSIDYNKDAASILGMAFVFNAGTYVSKAIVTALGVSQMETFSSLLFYIAWFVAFGMFLLKNYSVFPKIIVAEMVYWGVYLLSCNMFPNTLPLFIDNIMFLRRIALVFIPCGGICLGCTQFEGVFERLKPFAFAGSVILLVAVVVRAGIDYQSLGTYLAPFLLILFVNLLRNRTAPTLMFFIINALFSLASGRQTLVIVVVGCVLIYLFENRKKPTNIIAALIVGSVILLFLFLLLEPLVNMLISLLASWGLDDYLLNMVLGGEFFSTSTRDVIYESSALIINRDGAQLSGLFGSVFKIRQIHSWIAYPHNIIYDFLIDFGTVLGGIFLVILLYKIIRQSLSGESERRLLIIFLADIAIVRLLVSGNYLIEGSFYILLLMLMKRKPIRFRKLSDGS